MPGLITRWRRWAAPALCLLAICAAGGSQAFEFVALGDLPYGKPDKAYPPYRDLIARINQLKPEFSIHVGDFKSGSTPCSNEEFAAQVEHFGRFESALVYTPGDNEWTDCHRANNGAYDPIERLARLRQMFFPPGKSLGQAPLRVVNQSATPAYAKFVENQRWLHQGVLFATLHVVGSNNNLTPKVASAVAEFQERDQANRAWLREAFAQARQTSAKALVLAMQADVFQGHWFGFGEGAVSVGFRPFINDTLLPLAAQSTIPILLLHGDSHRFVVDQPFRLNGQKVKQLTRLQVPGAGDVRAVRVSLDLQREPAFQAQLITID